MSKREGKRPKGRIGQYPEGVSIWDSLPLTSIKDVLHCSFWTTPRLFTLSGPYGRSSPYTSGGPCDPLTRCSEERRDKQQSPPLLQTSPAHPGTVGHGERRRTSSTECGKPSVSVTRTSLPNHEGVLRRDTERCTR